MSKAAKIILIIVGVLVFLLFVVPLFLPSQAVVKKTVVVERPLELIYDDLLDFSVYKQWNPWSPKDPEAETNITGNPGEVGHKWEWKGEVIGEGSLEIKSFETYKSIQNELIFVAPWESVAEDLWELERTEEGHTNIIWMYKQDANYPFGRFMGLMVNSMVGKDYEEGLKNLKAYFETNY